jgi:hypothetical protein
MFRHAFRSWVLKFLEVQTGIKDKLGVGRPVKIAMLANNFTLQVSRDL